MITVVSLEIRAKPNVDTFFGTNMVVLISEVTLFQNNIKFGLSRVS